MLFIRDFSLILRFFVIFVFDFSGPLRPNNTEVGFGISRVAGLANFGHRVSGFL